MQRDEFKQRMSASGWNFEPRVQETAQLLRDELPALRANAGDESLMLAVSRSFGRVGYVDGWAVATYRQSGGNERDPRPNPLCAFVLCDDGVVRVSTDEPPATVSKWHGVFDLDRFEPTRSFFDSQEALLAFGNTPTVAWTVCALRGEGDWHDVVLANLEPAS